MATVADYRRRPSIVEEMRNVTIPARIDSLIETYETVTSDRDELLWKWLYYVFPEFRLSSVPDRYSEAARDAKFCFSVFMTVLDDLSERHRDRQTFQQGRKIPFPSMKCRDDAPGVDGDQLELLRSCWSLVERFLETAPRREGVRELFEFDLRQSLNTMDYNRLVNEGPRLASPKGVELYDTHNMLLFIYVDIDLAFSPSFDRADLATLRDVTWEAQKLARIGNWVTTWEREIRENDFTSMVVVDAVERGVVTTDELRSDRVTDERLIERIRASGIEHDHLLTWNRIYRDLSSREYDVESVDVHSFVDGMRHLLEVDVKARGYK